MNIKTQIIVLLPFILALILYGLFSLIAYWWGSRSVLKTIKNAVKDPLEDMYEGLMQGKTYHNLLQEKTKGGSG